MLLILEYWLTVFVYLIAVLLVSLDFVRYVVWTLPTVSRLDYHAVRDTIILIGCQLMARLLLIGVAGRTIFAGMV